MLLMLEMLRMSPRGGRHGCQLNQPQQRPSPSQKRKRLQLRKRSRRRKCQLRERRELKASRPKRLTKRRPRTTCHLKMERQKAMRPQRLMEETRNRNLNNLHLVPSLLSVVPVPPLYNSEEYFYQLFCKCKFFSSLILENTFLK